LVEALDRGEVPTTLSNRSMGTDLDEALLEAILNGDRAAVDRLLVEGADVNAKVCTMAIWASGDEFDTPLIVAAECGDLEMVKHLLGKGADASVEREIREDVGYDDYRFEGTGEYESAADVASKAGHPTVAELLRQRER
jgi:ankyrin repeat protein